MVTMASNEFEIFHHGIRGMHWGIRRYQNKDGSLTPAGRKRYMSDEKFRNKYIEKKKREEEAKKRAAETAEQRHKRLLESADANELYKHRSELTTAEIRDRISRIQAEQDLAKYMTHEPTTKEKVGKFIDGVSQVAKNVDSFLNTPAGKNVQKWVNQQFGVSPKTYNYSNELDKISTMTNDQVKSLAERAKNEQSLRRAINDITNKGNKSKENSQKLGPQLTEEEYKKLKELLDKADN